MFDNTVKSLDIGGVNCNFTEVILMYITDLKENVLLNKIVQSSKLNLDVIFKYQNYYDVWNPFFNEENFNDLIKEIDEGLR